jgi:preprotein translocase subunit SecF
MSVVTDPPQAQSAGDHRSFTARLYRGEVGIKISDWRRRWFLVAGIIALVAVASMGLRGFSLGMDFVGGTSFQLPASVGTLAEVEDAVGQSIADADAEVVSGQRVGGAEESYLIRTTVLESADQIQTKNDLAERFGITPEEVSDNLVSASWGAQVSRQALIGLMVFLGLVVLYLIVRFEARMAVAAVSGLLLSLVTSGGVYALSGFEVTPATVIGFLTIMGFGLYDTVVVFDKIHENTSQTYGEAANLAVNQTLMRSINTSVVALLPVGGLLFIGAGLLGAGTLKDLGLVLFVGMGVSFFASLFFAAPLLVELKLREPKYRVHTQRVLARRVALASRGAQPAAARTAKTARAGAAAPAAKPDAVVDPHLAELAGSAPKVGARPPSKRPGGGSRKRPGGRRR